MAQEDRDKYREQWKRGKEKEQRGIKPQRGEEKETRQSRRYVKRPSVDSLAMDSGLADCAVAAWTQGEGHDSLVLMTENTV